MHDCKGRLKSVKDRFCEEHQDDVELCAVITCQTPAQKPFRTCSIPEHRAIETQYDERGKALFQLRQRLQRLRVRDLADDVSVDNVDPALEDGDLEFDDDGVCEGKKSDQGNRKPRARFGRRRTHNEQLCVGSCKIIHGRATFYGSEGMNGVRVSRFNHLLVVFHPY